MTISLRDTPIAETSALPRVAPAWSWTTRLAPMVLAWAALALILLLRNPSFLLRAEFWAEDGWAWFPQAYTDGWLTLARPVAGYLQTVPRLAGLAVQAAPMAWAPTVFAAVALAAQALPPAFLVSSRMQQAWPCPPARLAFALVWLALPNAAEEYVNLTNTQWHLATLAFLVLLADVPRTRRAAAFDVATLVLCGLSGPFCLLLLPIAALLAIRRHAPTAGLRAAIMLVTVTIQAAALLTTTGARSPAPLGATAPLLARIVAEQVLLAPLIGERHMAWLQALPAWQSGVLPAAVLAAGAALGAAALWRGPALLRMACVLAALALGAALAHPQVTEDGAQWPGLLMPGGGQRYYLMPMLAWLGVLLWAVARRHPVARAGAAVLALALGFGIWSDWSVPGRRNTGFPARAAAFLHLPPGAAAAFPINPMLDRMPMILVRR